MPVFNATGVIEDRWVTLGETDPIPANASVVLPWARVAADGTQFLQSHDPRGLMVSSDIDETQLVPLLPRLGLIVVQPTNFKDGRIFSVGRLLRQRHGFKGDLRVKGEFIPDQIPFLVRCGFTSFDAPPAFDVAAALRLLAVFPFNYQTGVVDRNITKLRHGS